MDNKNKEQALNDFLNDEKKPSTKKVVIDEKSGLVERVDKIYITKSGKQLLREVY